MNNKPTYTILTVDDSAEDREIFCRYLYKETICYYQILEAELVSEALEICDRTLPDLILLDYLLPDDNGLVFLQEWQKRYRNSVVPVILLTGEGNETIATEAIKYGAYDYWVKGKLSSSEIRQKTLFLLQQLSLKRQIARQQEQQNLVNSIALRIRESLRLEQVLQRTVEEVRECLQTDRVLIYKFLPDFSGVMVAESVLPPNRVCFNLQFEDVCFKENYLQPYRQGRVFVASDIDIADIAECHREMLKSFDVRANLVVPLLLSNYNTSETSCSISKPETEYNLWGLLIAHQCDRPRQWQDDEINLLQQLALQLVIAIQQAEMYEWLETELYKHIDAELLERQRVAAEFRALVENATDIIYRIDLEMRAVYFNPAIEKLMQQPATNLIGKTLEDLGFCAEIINLWNTTLNQIIQTKTQETIEHPFPDLNSSIWLQIRIVPEFNEAGEVYSFLCIARDISQNKHHEQMLKFQAEILERIHDSVVSTDLSGKICTWNRGAEKLYGYTAAEAIGQNISILYYPEDFPQLQSSIFQPLLAKGNHEVEFRNRTKSGQQIYISLRLSVIRDQEENIIYLIGCSNDISQQQAALQERKKIEKQLQQFNQELETRVEERTAELQESQRFIQSITDNTPNILYIYDLDEQRNIYFNRAIVDILGYSPEQIQGMENQFLLDLVHPDDLDSMLIHLNNLHTLQNGEKRNCEYRLRDVNGEWHWLLSRDAAFLYNKDGTLKQIVGTAQDITERKQSEEKLQNLSDRLSLAIKSGGFGIWEWDILQDQLIWDEQMYELYGLEKSDVLETIYQTWANALHPQDRERTETAIQQALRSEKEYNPEFRVVHPNGSIRYIKAYALVQRDNNGEPQRMVGVNFDITSAKEAEKQLRQVNERLTLTNAELDRATRLKDEFLANMSHELRTPLNAILGMSEGLQDGVFGNLSKQQKQAINSIDRSGNHLLALINDVLDLAKVESGKLELQLAQVSINYLCTNSVTFVRQQALKKNIQLTTKIPEGLANIVVDELRIRQVLINLLNNAVKFTPDGGCIKLEVKVIFSTPQNLLQFSVIDTGIGLTPENASKLFQPFIQIDSSLNRQYSGTGLGLALVRRLVELHQGTVGVTSELGKGSCFMVCLPYVVSKAPTVETTISPPNSIQYKEFQPSKHSPILTISQRPSSSTTLLLVEDNELNIATISSYLSSKGYKIEIAKNGEEGVTLAKSLSPDLILMDIQLPKVDGLEAIRQIRAEQRLTSTPIIALTALAMTGDQEKCLNAGANDYLSKPVKLKQLVEKIEDLLN
ncbi:Sensory/regulatory protein RpfC [Planktothrix tepida]|uniref:PAS domain S-box protein n=2 Tax=Planktothrix tepida TaxID=1678309 RepID=UPI0020B24956|nr:PAS domain S-box protein [Planktothrix tepida]CAD5924885.1 Sensory/regulatory protein RpfC [Planktothrix tepida]